MTMFPPATIHYPLSNGTTSPPTNKHGPIGSPLPTEGMVVALRWLTAIQEATQCLRDRPNGEESQHSVQAIEHALKYLMKLEAILQPLEPQWDQGPSVDPPKFVPYKPRRRNKKKRNATVRTSPTSVVDQAQKQQQTLNRLNENRFALFEDSDDEEEPELKGGVLPLKETGASEGISGKTILSSSRSTGSNSYDDCQEAGDIPTLNRIAHFPAGNIMNMRRLIIRIVTSESELYAFLATTYRRRQLWSKGAENCHASLCKIHMGLIFADSEISRCLAQGGAFRERQPLIEDASIVEVAVKSLTLERDSFVQKALTVKHQLARKLEAMNIGRYKARARLGDKWYQNNHKKPSNFQQLRNEKEDELVEIQMALDNLCQWDTHSLLASAGHLKLRLYPQGPRMDSVSNRPRNNQRRPNDISDRVDLALYPDPTLYGWKFTGSYIEPNGGVCVEFFSKHNILLDFYYTTGNMELWWTGRHEATSFFRSEGPVHSQFYVETLHSKEPWKIVDKYMDAN